MVVGGWHFPLLKIIFMLLSNLFLTSEQPYLRNSFPTLSAPIALLFFYFFSTVTNSSTRNKSSFTSKVQQTFSFFFICFLVTLSRFRTLSKCSAHLLTLFLSLIVAPFLSLTRTSLDWLLPLNLLICQYNILLLYRLAAFPRNLAIYPGPPIHSSLVGFTKLTSRNFLPHVISHHGKSPKTKIPPTHTQTNEKVSIIPITNAKCEKCINSVT